MATLECRAAVDSGADPEPMERLEARICAGAADLTAAEAAWLLDVAEFDRRGGWAADGALSCAAWLAWQVGLDRRAAREKVRVAHALVAFPAFASAMSSGALTYSKARAITRIADEHNAAELLELALESTSNQLERFVAAIRRCGGDHDADDRSGDDDRSLHASTTGATMELVARVPVEVGTALLAAIDAFVAAEPGTDLRQRRADALVELAEQAVAAKDAGHPPVGPRYLAALHLDEEALSRLANVGSPPPLVSPPGGGCCSVGHGERGPVGATAVPDASARRMLCDAALETTVSGVDGNPLFAGRSTRTVNRRLRRALHHRDGTCRFPGCTHHGWLDAHHIVHWLDQGRTDVDNLVLLCRRHHRFVHENGWTIVGSPGGELAFRRPDGTLLAAGPPVWLGDPKGVRRHRRSPDDGRCRWAGDRFDLGYIVANHLHNHELARARASAAAS